MKIRFFPNLAVALFLFFFCGMAGAQQLVLNSGLGGSFTNWTRSGNLDGTSVTVDTNYVHSGSSGAKLGPGFTLGYLSQTIPTTPGQVYNFSLWVKNPDGGVPNEFLASWNGTNVMDVLNIAALGWINFSFNCTATDTNTVILLGFRDDPSYLGLDDVTVYPGAGNNIYPAIYQGPTNKAVSLGKAGSFGVGAVGNGVLQYQWQFNGTNLTNGLRITGATNSVLTISNVVNSDYGPYSVVVSDDLGQSTSSNAILSYLTQPAVITWTNPAPITNGTALGTNQLNATADVSGTFAYNPPAGTVLPLGQNTLRVVFTPDDSVNYSVVTNSVTIVVYSPASPGVNFGFETGNFSGWTRTGNTADSSVDTSSFYAHSGTYGAKLGPGGSLGYLSQTIATTPGQPYVLSCWLDSVDAHTITEFLVSWDGTNLLDQTNLGAIGWVNLKFNCVASSNNTVVKFGFRNDPAYFGLDEISVTPGILTNNIPVILQHPVDQSVLVGSPASFNVAVSGDSPISFQWQLNGTNLVDGPRVSGSTNQVLLLTNTVFSDFGNYSVIVSDAGGQTNSLSAALNIVYLNPVITWTNPSSIFFGTPLSSNQLNATASVQGSFTYSPPAGSILGAGTNFLTAVFTPTDTLHYSSRTSSVTLMVLNPANPGLNLGFESGSFSNWTQSGNTELTSVDTNALYVHSGFFGAEVGPTTNMGFLSQILSTVSNQPYVLSFWMTHPGGGSPNEFKVSWNGTNLMDQVNVSSNGWLNLTFNCFATGTNTLLQFGFMDYPDYFGLDDVSITLGTTTNSPPVMLAQPSDQLALLDGSASFYAGAAGDGPISYQWQFNGTNLTNGATVSGASSPTLVLSNIALTDFGNYSVLVTNLYSQTNSLSASLARTYLSPIVTWINPAPIVYGTLLGSNQLNAQSSVPGSFAYTPDFGAQLNPGTNLLNTVFTPSDPDHYLGATNQVSLLVLNLVNPGLNLGFEAGTFTNWLTSGGTNTINVVTDPSFVHSGNFGARLGPALVLGNLSQTFPTVPGQPYVVSFWVNNPDGRGTNEFIVSWNGTNLLDQVNMGSNGWVNLQFNCVATAANTTLQFSFRNDPGFFGLDDVSIRQGVLTNNPPVILLQPANQYAQSGGTASFIVGASGDAPLAFQWQLNGTNLADTGRIFGSASNMLTITNVLSGDYGSYSVLVSDSSGQTNSEVALLSAPSGVQIVYSGPYTIGTLAGLAGITNAGSTNGIGSAARFNGPSAIALDNSGNLYVADTSNSVIRKVTANGVVSTLAGLEGVSGTADGNGSSALFNHPAGIALDNLGNIFVSDTGNCTIRKITPSGDVTTLAGLPGFSGRSNGPGVLARFLNPQGLVVDSAGNIFVADSGNFTIRKINSTNLVTTFAGLAGEAGDKDATGTDARFGNPADTNQPSPTGLAMDTNGNIFVADSANGTIRKITPGAVVTTFAGFPGSYGSLDAIGGSARFFHPTGISINAAGNIYVADSGNLTVRMITPQGVVSTLAGVTGLAGSADGPGTSATFNYPNGIAVSPDGGIFYVANYADNTIRFGVSGNYSAAQTASQSLSTSTGQLAVTLLPASLNGQWRLSWETAWHDSGTVLSNLAPGNYSVLIRSLPGYLVYPASPQSVMVSSNLFTFITNQYFPTFDTSIATGTGALIVNISTNGASSNLLSGIGWRFLGEVPWRASGALVGNLSPDGYFVEFEPVTGYSQPHNQAVMISAGATNSISVAYLSSQSLTNPVAYPVAITNSTLADLVNYPFGYNGRLITDAGTGSGVAVQTNVVLTAAHLVFNDQTLWYVNNANWFWQAQAGVVTPDPLPARGWYLLSGYAAQRTNDLQAGFLPEQPSPQSSQFDVAALYFDQPVAGGGQGGYLSSDTQPNPWMTTSINNMLVGYPVDGSSFGISNIIAGQMYQTGPQPFAFSAATNSFTNQQVYLSTNFFSFSGNDGGPMYAQYDGSYYPVGIYLGNLYSASIPYASMVRAIDSNVVSLISLAASQGAATNLPVGTILIVPSPMVSSNNPGFVTFNLGPASAVAAGAAWQFSDDGTNYSTATNFARAITSTNPVTIQFKPLPGWILPTDQTVSVQPNQLYTGSAFYTVTNPVLAVQKNIGIGLTGTLGTTYRIEFRVDPTTDGSWSPYGTNTIVTNGFNLIAPFPLTNTPTGFYRAVWLP